MRRFVSSLIFIAFVTSLVAPYKTSWANQGGLGLPEPGAMVNLSPTFEPVMMKGLKIDPKNPFRFEFILDTGNSGLNGGSLQDESRKLIKYFLASLTIPEKDLWVNLSPYEKDKMIASNLAQTEMGRDMLAQDYILKQLTASLIYPEKDLGKAFWNKVYQKAQQLYGNIEIPVNTFNKVWIVADKADVFERSPSTGSGQANVAYVVGAHLRVMLEEDYVALNKNNKSAESRGVVDSTTSRGISTEKKSLVLSSETQRTRDGFNSSRASEIVREVLIPAIETEVNTGKNFAPLRQMFYSMILASWYKTALKDAILTQIYGNQSKVKVGINQADVKTNDEIFNQYLKAYKKGVFNYIKEDIDKSSQPFDSAQGKQPIARKYFSGGEKVWGQLDHAQTVYSIPIGTSFPDHAVIATVDVAPKSAETHQDAAMLEKEMLDPLYFLGKAFTLSEFEAAYFLSQYIRHARSVGGVPVIVVSAPSGAGKSTLAQNAKKLLEEAGLKAEVFGLDMFMIDRQERYRIINGIHEGLLNPDAFDESNFFDNDRIQKELLDPLMAFKRSRQKEKVFEFDHVNIPGTKTVGSRPPVTITKQTVVIIEGKYAHIPAFLDHYGKNYFHAVIRKNPKVVREQFRKREEGYRTLEQLRVLMDVYDRFFVPSYEQYLQKSPSGIHVMSMASSEQEAEETERHYDQLRDLTQQDAAMAIDWQQFNVARFDYISSLASDGPQRVQGYAQLVRDRASEMIPADFSDRQGISNQVIERLTQTLTEAVAILFPRFMKEEEARRERPIDTKGTLEEVMQEVHLDQFNRDPFVGHLMEAILETIQNSSNRFSKESIATLLKAWHEVLPLEAFLRGDFTEAYGGELKEIAQAIPKSEIPTIRNMLKQETALPIGFLENILATRLAGDAAMNVAQQQVVTVNQLTTLGLTQKLSVQEANDLERRVVSSLKLEKPAMGRYEEAKVYKETDTIHYFVKRVLLYRPKNIVFIRVGHLFLIDQALYRDLNQTLRDKYAGNFILIPRMGEQHWADLTDRLKYFASVTIMAMMQLDLQGKRFVDVGSGDGILSVIAKKLGASQLVLIEKDGSEILYSKELLQANGIDFDGGVHFIQGDILNPVSIMASWTPSQMKTVVSISIGTWPINYGNTTNLTGLRLISLFPKEEIQHISNMVLGGYMWGEYTMKGISDLENQETQYAKDKLDLNRRPGAASVGDMFSVIFDHTNSDVAMTPGGIDFDRTKMQMNVFRGSPSFSNDIQGTRDEPFRFNPAMVEKIKREGFDGLEFTIRSIESVADLPLLLGVK